MIAAPVQCDVDGIPQGSHGVRVPPLGEPSNDKDRAEAGAVVGTAGFNPATMGVKQRTETSDATRRSHEAPGKATSVERTHHTFVPC